MRLWLRAMKHPVRFDSQPTEHAQVLFEEWAHAMGVDAPRLREAVDAVGIVPRNIRRYLRETAPDTTRESSRGRPSMMS
jgi:hypothetical protein